MQKVIIGPEILRFKLTGKIPNLHFQSALVFFGKFGVELTCSADKSASLINCIYWRTYADMLSFARKADESTRNRCGIIFFTAKDKGSVSVIDGQRTVSDHVRSDILFVNDLGKEHN